ncbi:hypothetical protein PK35_02715 [Tamlana nanhaiensis]|uniref:DUF5013 domain-containing protein n=1 Tax=Neotamlana nanhaiensis TaxID=1382798 RepID=A0A0D7W6B3_9FLAO|nr:DUF4998 domain-containing protein [Tamlana nanhaiensis]KJD34691.1 hypothetical protein PK35_02715 [Tamlana nanhaiensis]
MKKLKNIITACCILVMAVVIYSCTSDTEYLKYTEGGEISYTAAIDSLEIFSGQNRVRLEGLIIGDPKVTEARVYWNNNSDSISIPVSRTGNVDAVSQIIDGLDESIYNFVVKTFDAEGNSSIPVSQTAEVFGDRYIASLFNRPLISNILVGNELVINFAEMDLNSGVVGSEVQYTNTSDELVTVFVNITEPSLTITDFKEASSYQYRTAFVPVETAIDNFFTALEEVKPVPTPVLQNAAVPFVAAESSGRWGTLAAPWITNDAAKTHDGLGGWDEWNGNVFNLESGWGAPHFTDGKIYQVVNAEPATFYLKVEVLGTNHASNADGAYFVITKGDGIPNTADVETAPEVLGYKKIAGAGSYTVEFTVDETTDISVGQVSTQNGDHFCNITSWEIIVAN